MSTKKPSIATQLKTLKVEYAAQAQEVSKLTKQLEDAKRNSDYTTKSRDDAQAELNQAHALLDALPNAIPRQSDPNEYGGRTNHALATRIGAWLAVRP